MGEFLYLWRKLCSKGAIRHPCRPFEAPGFVGAERGNQPGRRSCLLMYVKIQKNTNIQFEAMKKAITIAELKAKFHDGMSIMIGGFLANGTPERIVDALVESGVRDLTMIVNDTSYPDRGCGRLIANKQVKRLIVSHIGTNPMTGEQMNNGELEVEFSPQGTLAERLRAGGSGLGGILTATGLGTDVARGKQTLTIDGREYLLELPLRADFAFIKGTIGDETGNLVYKGTTQNFQPLMAMAADCVIAEIEQVVPVGGISPEAVHTPSIFVDYILQ